MRRYLAFFLICALALSACGRGPMPSVETSPTQGTLEPEWQDLSDPEALKSMEQSLQTELLSLLSGTDVTVEAVYVSQEYLEELRYNSQQNLFFGMTLEELQQAFGGQFYGVTYSTEGEPQVTSMEEPSDILGTLARSTGSGKVMVCITLAGVAAVSRLFLSFDNNMEKTTTVIKLVKHLADLAEGAFYGVESSDFSALLRSLVKGNDGHFLVGVVFGKLTDYLIGQYQETVPQTAVP